MQNPLKKYLILGTVSILMIHLLHASPAITKAIQLDSASASGKTWHRITNQMHRFTKTVNAYVRIVTKIKPADTVYTKEVKSYADSVDKSIARKGPDDTSGMQKIERLFDSLVYSSGRLIKKVETDSAFANNKAVKQLTGAMQNIRIGIGNYQKELNENAARRKEKKQTSNPPRN
ncbi:MAG: hypothetical protein KG003_02550 [Bacteroidetes bacterium]|nr:hypothetical protein [Bacteroidota bacterium]